MQKRFLQFFFISLFVSLSIGTKAQFSGVKWQTKILDSVFYRGDWPPVERLRKATQSNKNELFVVGRKGIPNTYSQFLGRISVSKFGIDKNLLWQVYFGKDWVYGYTADVSEVIPTDDGGFVGLTVDQTKEFGYEHPYVGDPYLFSDIYLCKFSESGTLEWQQYVGGTRWDFAHSLEIDRYGNILVAGQTWSATNYFAGKRRSVDTSSAAYKSVGGIFDTVYRSYDTLIEYDTNFKNEMVRQYMAMNDAFVAKFSSSGQLINIKCFGGSLSDNFIHIKDHPDYGYVAVGFSDSKDLDLPVQGTKGGLWMLYLDTALNIVQNKIIDSTLTGGSSFFVKDKKMYLSDSLRLRELGYNGTVINDRFSNGVKFDLFCYFDQSGYVYKTNENGHIAIYDTALQFVDSIKFPGSRSGTHFVDGTNRNNLYLINNNLFEERYHDIDFEWNVYSNTVIHFAEQFNFVQGRVFFDKNSNQIRDNDELYINGLKIEARNNRYTMTVVSGTDGFYSLPLDSGHYTIQLSSSLPYYSVFPSSVQVQFPGFDKVDTIHFALQPNGSKNDLSINLLPLSIARPGFETRYRIVGYNKGTVAISNVQVKMRKDARVNLLSSMPVVSSVINDTLTWNIGTVQPLDSFSIDMHCRIAAPPVVNNADTLRHAAFILPVTGDETAVDNQVQVAENVQGSYDPNDKTETHGGVITPAQVAGNEYLTYLIRFQNTGTDTAFNVMIRDTLQNKLNWGSFEMIAASHPYQLYMIRPDVLEWSFPNILLPDSNRNEPASHGFIAYRIRPQSNLSVGDTVLNRAHIYFDYNLPVITNDAETIVRNQLVTAVVNRNRPANELLLYPNPANGQITVQWKGRIAGAVSLRLYDALGKLLYQKEYGMQVSQPFNQVINTSDLLPGLYIITLQIGKDTHSVKLVVR